MKNNKGFSYVEMLLVLAIMGIMVGMITVSASRVSRTSAARVSETLETNCNQARVNALSKGTANGYLNIAVDGGSVYTAVGPVYTSKADVKSHGEKIGSGKLELFVGGSTFDEDNEVLHIQYDQGTGGIYGGANTAVMVKNGNKSSSFIVIGSTGKIKK